MVTRCPSHAIFWQWSLFWTWRDCVGVCRDQLGLSNPVPGLSLCPPRHGVLHILRRTGVIAQGHLFIRLLSARWRERGVGVWSVGLSYQEGVVSVQTGCLVDQQTSQELSLIRAGLPLTMRGIQVAVSASPLRPCGPRDWTSPSRWGWPCGNCPRSPRTRTELRIQESAFVHSCKQRT